MKHIYEIPVAPWLATLSTKIGMPITLATIPEDVVEQIVSYHMDTVWLMGVWQRSEVAAEISRADEQLWHEVVGILPDATKDDIIGSAYAVKAYRVDERFGGEDGLAIFREQLRARGIKLLLDFVPNHTSFDAPWLKTHPEYYIAARRDDATEQPERYYQTEQVCVAKGADPNLPPWPDVAQVNAFSSAYRLESSQTLQYIASLCDGVRCDMAMLLLNDVVEHTWAEKAGQRPTEEYWSEVISSVKALYPSFVFIAECYWDTERTLLELGFDYCYDKRLYDAMVARDESAIDNRLSVLSDVAPHLVYFLENHDEARAATVFSPDEQTRYAQKIITSPGVCLWYDGQFVGNQAKLPTHIGRAPIEKQNDEICDIYRELLV